MTKKYSMGIGAVGVLGVFAAMVGLAACEQSQPSAKTQQEAPAAKAEAAPAVETASVEETTPDQTAAAEGAKSETAPESAAGQPATQEGSAATPEKAPAAK